MKRENLLLVAGALLASTSITTAANAGTIFLKRTDVTLNPTVINATNLPVISVAAQAFTSATANTQTSATFDLILRFSSQLPVAFNGEVVATGAQFATSSNTALGLAADASGTFIGNTVSQHGTAICTSVLANNDKIFLQNCNGATSFSNGAGVTVTASGLVLTNVSFKTYGGLATASSSISLAATIYLGTAQSTAIDTTTAAAKVTSRNPITVQGGPATAGVADVSATKGAFTALTAATGTLSISLGSVVLSIFPTVGQDLSTAVLGAGLAGAGNELKVTSAVFADDATQQVRFFSNTSGVSQTFSVGLASGFATLTLTAAQVGTTDSTFNVVVDFNGTKEIDTAAAGTAAITFTNAGGNGLTGLQTTLSSGSVATTSISRNGLTVDLNGVYGGGFPITYTSVVRVVNTGAIAGSPTIAIYDETTGSLLGTASTLTPIPVNGSGQYTAAQIEANAGLTASTLTYRLSITAGISGYAQQLLWNQTSGFFTDLSSRRGSKNTSTTGQ